jgi:hypothetical protein
MSTGSDDLAAWRSVRTYADLGLVTAAWLRGEEGFHPMQLGAIDEETNMLIDVLAAINERGLVTDGSQPGVPIDAAGSGQRAFLDAVSDETTAWRVMAALRCLELVVLAFPPGRTGRGQIVVTLDEGEEATWCGWHDPEGYTHVWSEVSPTVDQLHRDGWWLQIIDPVWGRNDVLWDAVLRSLEETDDER